MPAQLFKLGRVVATRGAFAFMGTHSIDALALLSRHVHGDWGNLDHEDRQLNLDAIERGGRIFSAYDFPVGKIWIITESDRSVTTILLPSEY